MLVAIPHAGVGDVMAKGGPQGPLARQGRGLPLLGSLQWLRCPGSAPGEKSGVCKEAQHHAKVLNIPLQGDGGLNVGLFWSSLL